MFRLIAIGVLMALTASPAEARWLSEGSAEFFASASFASNDGIDMAGVLAEQGRIEKIQMPGNV